MPEHRCTQTSLLCPPRGLVLPCTHLDHLPAIDQVKRGRDDETMVSPDASPPQVSRTSTYASPNSAPCTGTGVRRTTGRVLPPLASNDVLVLPPSREQCPASGSSQPVEMDHQPAPASASPGSAADPLTTPKRQCSSSAAEGPPQPQGRGELPPAQLERIRVAVAALHRRSSDVTDGAAAAQQLQNDQELWRGFEEVPEVQRRQHIQRRWNEEKHSTQLIGLEDRAGLERLPFICGVAGAPVRTLTSQLRAWRLLTSVSVDRRFYIDKSSRKDAPNGCANLEERRAQLVKLRSELPLRLSRIRGATWGDVLRSAVAQGTCVTPHTAPAAEPSSEKRDQSPLASQLPEACRKLGAGMSHLPTVLLKRAPPQANRQPNAPHQR